MGRETVRAVQEAADMELVGACDVACSGRPIGEVVGVEGLAIPVVDCFAEMLGDAAPDVIVDFAKPFSLENTVHAMEKGVVPIIGTTGQTSEELAKLDEAAGRTGCGVMVIPNFAVGAVLMMKFAAEAARYMPSVEIIELHHDQKADAPSGTSTKTAEMIDEARKNAKVDMPDPAGPEGHPARGDVHGGVQIHSVRLPGLVAHQEVLFGGKGQLLTIRHDSIDRTSFMPGVLLAVRRATNIQGLVYGLDKLL
jgi:4-hydroxy-tetrahydrodipicolinate reductase